jgi:uncharacterized protein (DUF305 family)
MKTRWLLFGAPVALALLLILAPIATIPGHAQMGPMMGPSLDQLSGDEFDKAFLSQMTMHHAMAVMMARPVVANASHQELKDLAQGIINDQTRETAEMRSWAKEWYGIDLPDHVAMMDQMMGQGQSMPGMNPSGMAPGMGMPMQGGMPMGQMGDMSMMHNMSMMASLSKLPPQRLEVVFMSQMIPHHQGAIDMARLVPDRAAHQELTDLSQNVIESQAGEIDKMNNWLGSWYSL